MAVTSVWLQGLDVPLCAPCTGPLTGATLLPRSGQGPSPLS
jgi:hypothetical protein